ncbi:MAG TPA: sialate O-acetylesterase [Natronincola sp.]|nr:sialate O-acetylesterase [Natronincola sp.]
MTNQRSSITLAQVFGNGMVLQRDMPITIWGKAGANESLNVEFRDKRYTVETQPSGDWQLKLEPMSAGGPFELRITNGFEEIMISDVLIGDVWLLGGQSNMEFPINRTLDLYEDEVRNAEHSFIRQLQVPMVYDFSAPREDLSGGEWRSVTPETIMDFSAVGYFFAKAHYAKYGVPVGLVLTAIGGTPIEAWMSEEVIEQIGGYEEDVAKYKKPGYVEDTIRQEVEEMNRWYQTLNDKDLGVGSWEKKDFNDDDWESFYIPNSWRGSELEPINGSVWFRKEVEISEEMLEHDLLLRLGAIIDADEVYLNGTLVGETGYMYPPRKYPIPSGVIKPGVNTIALRVISNRDVGGFVKGKDYCIEGGPFFIDLEGPWKYKVGATMESLPHLTAFQYKPSGVFNGMIAPLSGYAFKGVLWYQGESNTDSPESYAGLFENMVANWRSTLGQPELPFLYVQLPNFQTTPEGIVGYNWAVLREQQLKSLNIPQTGMVVTIDIGEENDLHPQNKKSVGERLLLIARELIYGEEVVSKGPILEEARREGSKAKLIFTNVSEGIVVKEHESSNFEICGEDGEFHPATAEYDGETVLLYSQQVEEPQIVRYAWRDNPRGVLLFNKAGLPASPFRIKL